MNSSFFLKAFSDSNQTKAIKTAIKINTRSEKNNGAKWKRFAKKGRYSTPSNPKIAPPNTPQSILFDDLITQSIFSVQEMFTRMRAKLDSTNVAKANERASISLLPDR